MTCLKRLNDIFPTGYRGIGIFDALHRNVSGVDTYEPWVNDPYITNHALDIEYFCNISGNKIVSPLLDKFINGDYPSQSEERDLCKVIQSMYYRKWKKLYDSLLITYNPIENYSMVEQMTNDATVHNYGKTTTRTDNLSHTRNEDNTETHNTQDQRTDNLSDQRTDNLTRSIDSDVTETHNTQDQRTDNLSDQRTDNLTRSVDRDVTETHNTTETNTPNLTNNTENQVYGFNLVDTPVDSDTQTVTATGTETRTKTGTIETETEESQHDTGTQTTQHTGTTTSAKTGTVETETEESQHDTGTQTTQHTGTTTSAKTGTVETEIEETAQDTGTQTHADSGSDTTTRNYRLTRSGNIGVTTSQQMIESERALWLWDFFYQVVFPDLDRILTLPIY